MSKEYPEKEEFRKGKKNAPSKIARESDFRRTGSSNKKHKKDLKQKNSQYYHGYEVYIIPLR